MFDRTATIDRPWLAMSVATVAATVGCIVGVSLNTAVPTSSFWLTSTPSVAVEPSLAPLRHVRPPSASQPRAAPASAAVHWKPDSSLTYVDDEVPTAEPS